MHQVWLRQLIYLTDQPLVHKRCFREALKEVSSTFLFTGACVYVSLCVSVSVKRTIWSSIAFPSLTSVSSDLSTDGLRHVPLEQIDHCVQFTHP